jgi:hypothetical protein
MAFVPPGEDEVDVDVEFGWLVELLAGLIGGLFLGIDPLLGAVAADPLANLLARQFVASSLRSGVAGITPVSINNTNGWQVFLQHSDPLAPSNDAVSIGADGLCLLFRVLPGPNPALGNWAPAVCAGC